MFDSSAIKKMIMGHPKLVLEFKAFLSKWRPVTFEESLKFVKKVKARDYQLYLALFNILSREEQMSHEIYQDLQLLFQNHDDLHKELMRFKPHDRAWWNYNQISIAMFLLLLPALFVSWFLLLEQPLRFLLHAFYGS